MAKTTQTQDWLALGYRHDDVDLWERLCEFLEKSGPLTDSGIPRDVYYLVLRAKENTYATWLYDNQLMPVWYRTRASSRGGNGWLAKKDWQERIAIMRNPTSENLLAWWRKLWAKWQKSRIVRISTPGSGFAGELRCGFCGAVFQLVTLPEEFDSDEWADSFLIPRHKGKCLAVTMPAKIAELESKL